MGASSSAGPSGPPHVKHMVVGAGTIGRRTCDRVARTIPGVAGVEQLEHENAEHRGIVAQLDRLQRPS